MARAVKRRAGRTVQPWWVQMAVKATTVPAVGCEIKIGWPSRVALMASPTGMSATLASTVAPALAGPVAAARAGFLADEQPAITATPAAPATAMPAASTARAIVFCSEWYTSSLAAASLLDLGVARATDIDGGFQAWIAAGLPIA